MRQRLDVRIGDILHGYCNGYFGRDSYNCKRVEFVGSDYIVIRSIDYGTPDFLYLYNGPDWAELINKWMQEGTPCDCNNFGY